MIWIWPSLIILRNTNKCIGDDTKAAARQRLNCTKNKTKNIAKNDFQYANGIITRCNVARS